MLILFLIFSEILLQLFAGTGTVSSVLYSVFFAASFGLFFEGISGLFGKKKPLFEGLLSVLFAVYFSFQSVVKEIFGLYFSVSDAAGRTSNVLAEYRKEVRSGVITGAGRMLLFLLPVIAVFAVRAVKKRKQQKRKNPESGLLLRKNTAGRNQNQKNQGAGVSGGQNSQETVLSAEQKTKENGLTKEPEYQETGFAGEQKTQENDLSGEQKVQKNGLPWEKKKTVATNPAESIEKKAGWSAVLPLLIAAILLQQVTAVVTLEGPDQALFGNRFNFHYATEQFGLCESTLLSFLRSGDSADGGFVIDPKPEGTAEESLPVENALAFEAGTGPSDSPGVSENGDRQSTTDIVSADGKQGAVTEAGKQGSAIEAEIPQGTATGENGAAATEIPSGQDSNAEATAGHVAGQGSETTSEPANAPATGQGSEAVAGQEAGSTTGVASGQGSEAVVGQAAGLAAGTPSGQEPETAPVIEYNVMDLTLPGEEVSKKAAVLSEYVSSLEPSEKNEYTGIFAGKNLIMICAESYCDAFIRPELTPTLWRLTHNGFYFPEFYQPSWGGSTTTGELSMVLGLDSTAGNEAMQKIADNCHYFTMGNQLQRQGYTSFAFHNGSHTFYRRDLTHENLGYDVFFASGNGLEDFCGYSYPSDSVMIEGTLPLYLDKSPFSVYYMTVSGHPAYEKESPLVKEFYEQVDTVLGDEYYEKTKYYICYQMELEKALTKLVEALENASIADDTVIVLTADHYPYGLGNGATWHNDRDYINDLIKGKDSYPWNEDKTGLIIWSGCLEHDLKDLACEIREPVVSLDILPTVSNLFGVEFDSRLLPGRDVFADTEPLAFWNNLSWVTDKGKYLTKRHEFTPAEGVTFTEEEQKEYVEHINTVVGNRIQMCTSIMNLDYYGMIFDKEEEEELPEE